MNNIFYVAAVLFSIALVALIVAFSTDGALRSYSTLFFYANLAGGFLLTLFYFLITRKGKDRSV